MSMFQQEFPIEITGLVNSAKDLSSQAEKLSKFIENLAKKIEHLPKIPSDEIYSKQVIEFERSRRIALNNLMQCQEVIGKLVGDTGALRQLGANLVDGYLDKLFESGVPVKERLRSLAVNEDSKSNFLEKVAEKIVPGLQTSQESKKIIRKLLNFRFRQHRQNAIEEAIKQGLVSWDKKLSTVVGVGIDERIIEFPLAFDAADFKRTGRILDAGAAMNLPHIRELIGTPVASLIHFTQSGSKEMCQFQGDRYSYLFGDLRNTEFKDAIFDRILCISTLEHVGMDNSRYGEEEALVGSDDSHLQAVAEMLRILAPGGQLIITVPYGKAKNHGWYQTFDHEGIGKILEVCNGNDIQTKYYYYQNGWLEGDLTLPADITCAGTDVAGLCAVRIVKVAA